MNLLLHGIASEDADEIPVQVRDALAGKHGEYEMVLTNPPFGKKSSVTIVNEAGEEDRQSLVVHRDDFWASTSNKQLNFLQHVFTILKQHGVPRSSFRTTSSLKAALAKPSAENYSSKPMFTHCCVFRPASSTRKV